MTDARQIIMNFSKPPSLDDIAVMVDSTLEVLPEELLEFCEEIAVAVEEFPDEVLIQELDLESEYDLIAFYKSGKELAPGLEKKNSDEDDMLTIFRRPLLDMWCESAEDLASLLRHAMIEELGRAYDFSDSEVDEMLERHYQGML